MSIDPLDVATENDDQKERNSRLNAMVAVSIAIIATFMGICNVKDGNIVQAMQMAQVDRNDQWAFGQSKSIKSKIFETTAARLEIDARTSSDPRQLLALAREYRAKAAAEEKDKETAFDAAKTAAKSYDDWNLRDDQFDMSESALSLAISLFAITALTHKRWLYFVGVVPSVFGIILGLAGLFGWGIHPDAFAKFLGT